jgi:hypothetical protein
VEPAAVIYSQPQVDLQVTMGMGLLGVRMALINAQPNKPEGLGFRRRRPRGFPDVSARRPGHVDTGRIAHGAPAQEGIDKRAPA